MLTSEMVCVNPKRFNNIIIILPFKPSSNGEESTLQSSKQPGRVKAF